MRIEEELKLDYSDVLFRPKRSTLKSRKDVNLLRTYRFKYSKNELSKFLIECGLQDDAHHKSVAEYSKGMRQKVGIAIAYAKKAKIYLLDEPASGLDPLSSNELSELLKKLADNGSAILMASHDLFRVRETCQKIGILKNGCLVKEMRANDVTSEELEKVYINFMKS